MKKAWAPSAEAIAVLVIVIIFIVLSLLLALAYKGAFGSEFFRSLIGK